jgi:hypothetical protein
MSGVLTDPAAWLLIGAHMAALLMLHPAPVRGFLRARKQAGAAGRAGTGAGAAGRVGPPPRAKAQ